MGTVFDRTTELRGYIFIIPSVNSIVGDKAVSFFFYGFVPRAVDASVPWVIRYRAPLATLREGVAPLTNMVEVRKHSAR